MVNPDYQDAIDYAISQLKEKLPTDLIYHSVDHTECDILPAVEATPEKLGLLMGGGGRRADGG